MASIADVYVTVLPSTSQIAPKIKEAFRAVDDDAREAGRRWGREIERGVGDVKVKLDADTTKAKAEIKALDGETVKVKVDVDRSALDRAFSGGGGGSSGGGFPLGLNAGLVGIGLLPAAATAIADVAGAVQQLAGAGLVLPGVFAGIVSSVGVAALGMHGMGDALKALDKASDGTKASVEAANKALAKLPPSSAEAIKTIYGLKGTLQELQGIASGNLLEGFSGGLKNLVAADLPAVTRGIDGISRGLNQNLLQTMTSLGSGSSQGFLERIFGNTANAQGKLTAAIDPIVHAVGVLTAAGSDTLPRLATAVGNVATRFDKFITAADGDGRLAKWISEGIDGFTKVGNTLLNLGKSFTAITQAAGGGQGLLGKLEDLTSHMSTFLNSTEGQENLKRFFAEGRDMLGQLKDVALQVGPVLGGMFQAGVGAANLWLPVIREILSDINSVPGGAAAVVDAFVAWKTISGVASLANSLNTVAGLLKVTLPAAAAEGAASMSAALGPVVAMLAAIKLGTPYAEDFADKYLPHPANAPHGFVGLDVLGLSQDRGASPDQAPGQGTLQGGIPQTQLQAPAGTRDSGGVPAPPNTAPSSRDSGMTPQQIVDEVNRRIQASMPPPVSNVGIPAVSSYTPPVITEVPKGGSTPNLPYAGTADPYGVPSGYASPQYGLPAGTNSGGYGGAGAQFPPWVYALGQQFGVKPSTYPGHQESDRNEAGYAPNPGHENRGIDWSGPVDAMQRFADYLATIPQDLEQVIWRNPTTGQQDTIAGGRPVSGYYPEGTLQEHQNHVHTRQSMAIPLPGESPLASAYPGTGSTGLTSSDLSLRNAQQRVNDTQHTEEQAQGRLNELNAKGTATARQMEAAEYALAKAKREHQDAIDGLTVATDKYNKSSSKSGGQNANAESLGSSFLSGLGQIFGFDGSLFQDPTQFGLFKIFKAAMGLKFDPSKAAPGGGQGTGFGAGLPGMGDGGSGLGGILSAIPQAFGNLTVGSPGMPGMPAGGLDFPNQATAPAGIPGPGNVTINNGIDLSGSQLGVDPNQFNQQLNNINSSKNRYGPMLQGVGVK